LSGRQTLGVFEPKIPGVLEFGPLALFLAAHVVDGGVEELHHMELVEGQAGLRELRLHARDKGRRQVAADLLDGLGTSAMVEQVGLEPLEGRGILAFGDEDRPGLLQIDKEADVVVPPLAGRFIHPELPQPGVIGLLAGPVDVMLQHAPQAGVMLPEQRGDPLDRHGLGQDHDEGLKQEGKAAARTRPGQGHL